MDFKKGQKILETTTAYYTCVDPKVMPEKLAMAVSSLLTRSAQIEKVEVENAELHRELAQVRERVTAQATELEKLEKIRGERDANFDEVVRLRRAVAQLEGQLEEATKGEPEAPEAPASKPEPKPAQAPKQPKKGE